jgi:hypothetical protein
VARLSLGKRITYPRHRQLRRSDDELIGQAKNSEALLPQPAVALLVSNALLRDFVAGPVDFDDEPAAKTDEVEDILPERNLPLKLCSLASSIPNSAPDDGFGLNSIGALCAREAKKERSRAFGRHHEAFDSKLRVLNIRNHLAPLDPIRLASLGTFPRKGGKGFAAGLTFRKVGR